MTEKPKAKQTGTPMGLRSAILKLKATMTAMVKAIHSEKPMEMDLVKPMAKPKGELTDGDTDAEGDNEGLGEGETLGETEGLLDGDLLGLCEGLTEGDEKPTQMSPP